MATSVRSWDGTALQFKDGLRVYGEMTSEFSQDPAQTEQLLIQNNVAEMT